MLYYLIFSRVTKHLVEVYHPCDYEGGDFKCYFDDLYGIEKYYWLKVYTEDLSKNTAGDIVSTMVVGESK